MSSLFSFSHFRLSFSALIVSVAEDGITLDSDSFFLREDLEDAFVLHPDKPAVFDPEDEENATSYIPLSAVHTLCSDDFWSGLAGWTHTSASDYLDRFKTD